MVFWEGKTTQRHNCITKYFSHILSPIEWANVFKQLINPNSLQKLYGAQYFFVRIYGPKKIEDCTGIHYKPFLCR